MTKSLQLYSGMMNNDYKSYDWIFFGKSFFGLSQEYASVIIERVKEVYCFIIDMDLTEDNVDDYVNNSYWLLLSKYIRLPDEFVDKFKKQNMLEQH